MTKSEKGTFQDVYLQMFEDDSQNVRIYAFDWLNDTVVWKAAFTDSAAAHEFWQTARKASWSNLTLPSTDDLACDDTQRSHRGFSRLVADSREIVQENVI